MFFVFNGIRLDDSVKIRSKCWATASSPPVFSVSKIAPQSLRALGASSALGPNGNEKDFVKFGTVFNFWTSIITGASAAL